MPDFHDGSTDHDGSVETRRRFNGRKNHPRHADVSQGEIANGRVCLPESDNDVEPRPRRFQRAGSHPGPLHDVPEKFC